MKLLFVLSVLLPSLLTPARAQTAPAAVDPTLFQTTSYLRLAAKGGVQGDFGVIPAQTYSFDIIDPQTLKPVVNPFTGKPRQEKNQAYIYVARTPFVKIAFGGANYAVLDDKSMIAFSSTWDKPIPKGKLQFDVEAYGGNYLIKKGTRELVTVSSTGYVDFFTGVTAPAIRMHGGNYFIDANNDLWVIDYKGKVNHHDSSKVNTFKKPDGTETKWSYKSYPQAQSAGGNFFYQGDGTIVTIASDGTVLDPFYPAAKPAILGGNYYLGTDGAIYSIRYDGNLFKNGPSLGQHRSLGYSYIVYDKGQIAIIDGMGVVHTDAVRVSPTKTQFVKITKVTEALDPVSAYTPNTRK